jgi:DNA-directed RNA polymerase subunit RPC12/RpoP
MMAVFCQNCGTQNTDPGELLEQYRCGRCGQRTLVRIPDIPARTNAPNTETVLAAILGAGIGGSIGGPAGAIVGGFIGAAISGSKK